jgi:hypothetical protein
VSDRSGQARALTVFTPIRPGEEHALLEYLSALPRGAGSPLAASDRTHVARWLIVDRLPDYCVPRQDRLRRQQLLFSSSFDGDERSYLEELTNLLLPHLGKIWGRCEDFPGTQSRSAFVDWLLAHRVPTSFFFAAYGDQTVHDVRNALAAREQALAFALGAQGLEPQARLQAFRKAFP